MCQVHDPQVTKELRKRLKKRGWITAWKSLVSSPAELLSSFRAFTWTPGLNRSSRGRCRLSEVESKYVKHGFHVFLSRTEAASFAKTMGATVVPLKCRLEDFVSAGWGAFGRHTAVFRNAWLSQSAYRKAMA